MEYTDQTPDTSVLNKPDSLFKKAKKEFSRLRKMTLRKLSQCKQSGSCIAVSSSALGEGKFISFVEDIYQNGPEEIVVLKWYDKNNLVSLTHVFVEEILSVTLVDKRAKLNNTRFA
jgi:hypothetical protein